MNFQVMPDEILEWRASRVVSLIKYVKHSKEQDGERMEAMFGSMLGGMF